VNRSIPQYVDNLRNAARAQAGQTMAEYAVTLAVIILVCAAGITALSAAVGSELGQVTGIL
jgi:Flp pilus assembly pilin Flp